MIRDSVEFLKFTLADRDGVVLTGDTVEAALVPPGTATAGATWLPCTYISGTTWRTNSAITWSVANYPASSYRAYARVTDSPETPRALLGMVVIQ